MLQQVYNTAREQQENSKRYSKRTASLYDTVIILLNKILYNTKGHIEKNFNDCSLSFFIIEDTNTNNIPVSSLVLECHKLWGDNNLPGAYFLYRLNNWHNDKKQGSSPVHTQLIANENL